MTSSRLRLTAAAAGLLLTLTGCGGGEGDEASKAISDSIMDSQEEQGGGAAEMFSMKRDEADCIGDGFVEEIGVDKLKEYGFLTEDLKAEEELTNVEMAKDDAEAAADTLVGCADVQGMMTEAMGDVDARTRECLEEVLTDDALRTLFTKMFSGQQEEAGNELVQPMMECAAPGLPQPE